MAGKNGTILNPFVNGPYPAGAPLFPFLFLIAKQTICQFQSLRAPFPFRRIPFDHIRFSPKSHFRKGGFNGWAGGSFKIEF
jgi:hypothetical protein